VSYVRFAEDGSQVYVYEHVDGWIECCGCALAAGTCGKFYTRGACITHLRDHEAAGHRVPSWVYSKVSKRAQR
jgi:hypothetical protein